MVLASSTIIRDIETAKIGRCQPAPSSGHVACCGRTRARLAIGSRSCAAGSMPVLVCMPSRPYGISR